MNVLIVDDEIYAVRTLQKNIHWDILGIDQVYTAYNVDQAKQQLRKNAVDIVITDIEMPGESGLDLLRWIKESDYHCKSLCMTCHAEFEYAQKAIQYRVSDYIVKPLNLKKFSETVSHLVQQIREERLQTQWKEKGRLWDQNRDRLESVFWENLMDGIDTGSADRNVMEERDINGLHINYRVDANYMLALLSVKRINQRADDWKKNQEQMKYIAYDVLKDILLSEEGSGRCGWKGENLWVILDEKQLIDGQELLENCLEMIQLITGASMVAYVDRPHTGKELHACYKLLKKEDQKNVSVTYGIYNVNTKKDKIGGIYTESFLEYLRIRLEAYDFSSIKMFVEEARKEESVIDAHRLMTTVEQVKQEIYLLLTKENMTVSQFLTDDLLEAGKSIYQHAYDFENWTVLAMDRLQLLFDAASRSKENDMIAEVKRYIRAHVEERISREEIAAHVAFSPDYVTRLFKKETGISISEYTMEAKVERAKALIDEGSLNIGEIAMLLGYNSFSYFSEVFKRVTGVLPKDYRRTHS